MSPVGGLAVPDISRGRPAYQVVAPRKNDFEVEVDLRVLAEHPICHQEKVVPKVDDVSLVDGVFDGAFGRDGDEVLVTGEGVVVSSSS
ncbi:hypothetical protein Tco_1530992 [Tanacetum coccineum]